MTNIPTYLIKFDLKTNNNGYYYYQLLAKENLIIEKSGKVGVDHLYQVYHGGLEKFNNLINTKIFEGYKELQIEELNESYTQLIYQFSINNKVSGLILFDNDNVQNFVRDITNSNSHSVGLSYFVDCHPVTSDYKTKLGLVPELTINKALELLKEIDKVSKELSGFREYKNEELKSYLLDGQCKSSSIEATKVQLKSSMRDTSCVFEHLCDLVNTYFNLIPTTLESSEIIDLLLDKDMFIKVNQEICNLMLSYYDEIKILKSIRLLNIGDSDIKIELIPSQDGDFNRIFNLYKVGCKNSTRVKNVFKVQIQEFNKRFENKANTIGNLQIAWHGTNRSNIASILTRGLSLPGNLAVSKHGSTYGSGIYFSTASSKSLGYSNKWICSSSGSSTRAYLILASVAAGRYDVSGSNRHYGGEYNSVWVNKGCYNDELVVYSEDQAKVDYIVEVENY